MLLDAAEHVLELGALVCVKTGEGLGAEPLSAALLEDGLLVARLGEAHDALATVLRVERALDEAVALNLGEHLGQRPGLEVEHVHELALGHGVAVLEQRADDGRAPGAAPAVHVHVVAAEAEHVHDVGALALAWVGDVHPPRAERVVGGRARV